jgi:putative spermidine/putrescine transport system substrate-binding protein
MIAQVAMLRGQKTNLWKPLDLNKIPNHKNLLPVFIHKYPDGKVDGIGAVSWYITLVSNTKVFPEAPTSWGDMWAADKKDKLGLLALSSNSFLLEITATTFFGGTKILDTQDGIQKVLDKLAALKPNVKLWYRDEAQFEQALKAGEIPMGQYYHDVATLASKEHPVRSTFPKEGGVLDSGSWAVTKACKKVEEAQIFINYMCRPDIQKKLSLKVGTSPTVKRELTGLSAEDFAAVSSEIKPIIPRYDIYTGKMSDWINQKWTEMITK